MRNLNTPKVFICMNTVILFVENNVHSSLPFPVEVQLFKPFLPHSHILHVRTYTHAQYACNDIYVDSPCLTDFKTL